MSVLTPAEYATLLNEDLGDLSEGYVAATLDAIDLMVARHYGKPLTRQEFTDTVTAKLVTYGGQAALRAMARVTPLVSLASAQVYLDITTSQEISVTDALLDSRTGEILIPFGIFQTWTSLFRLGGEYRMVITYTAGNEAEVPTDVKRALALLAQEQMASDAQASYSGTDDIVAYKVGEYSEQRSSYTDRISWSGIGLGTRNSRIAQDILDSYYKTAGAVLI